MNGKIKSPNQIKVEDERSMTGVVLQEFQSSVYNYEYKRQKINFFSLSLSFFSALTTLNTQSIQNRMSKGKGVAKPLGGSWDSLQPTLSPWV